MARGRRLALILAGAMALGSLAARWVRRRRRLRLGHLRRRLRSLSGDILIDGSTVAPLSSAAAETSRARTAT